MGCAHDTYGPSVTTPRVPPPTPRGLGPHERAVAAEVRRHGHPVDIVAMSWQLPGVPRRALRHHLDRLQALGLIELAPNGGVMGWRWRPDAPPSVYDDLPLATCPRCGEDR
jgi:hypothetical protein